VTFRFIFAFINVLNNDLLAVAYMYESLIVCWSRFVLLLYVQPTRNLLVVRTQLIM